jgi:hypothetical protein
VFAILLSLALAVGPSLSGQTGWAQYKKDLSQDLTVWPNVISSANSDPWIVQNHDRIRKLEPRVLVLNFCNGYSMEDARAKAEQIAAAMAESSRYHGYEDPNALIFLEYKIAKLVDLRDADPNTPSRDRNSSKYPRVPNWKQGINFVYKELYSEQFAEYYGYKNPDHPSRYLRLNELVDRGIINELWFLAYHGAAGAPFETTEQKPVYDENFHRVSGQHRHAGNGGDPNEPWYGRSLRITFINSQRGIGCCLENFGHAFEGTAHANVIPYFRKYFYEYASFDLDKRYGLPVNSLYAVDAQGKDKAEYPDKTTMVVHHKGKEYKVSPYVPVGGNVHFTPNGRHDYDLNDPSPVMSTMEHYRLFDGPDGKDLTTEFTVAKFERYKELAPDCMGPWLVYWRQNMPGYKNKCRDDDGKPMKNWWVFLFY